MQDAAFVDPDDGITKIWSESHVSEGRLTDATNPACSLTVNWLPPDFDMSLRLQLKVSGR